MRAGKQQPPPPPRKKKKKKKTTRRMRNRYSCSEEVGFRELYVSEREREMDGEGPITKHVERRIKNNFIQ